ncbi:type II toxin-antitoxin system RelE/ParE family toxin [Anaerostipes caccae]|uniref:type II toxin-antitoxin system RelE/ParE family toxin n=1 Tax=Anaerostipes caccae TaxID=105841 RepID=UPI0038D4D94A
MDQFTIEFYEDINGNLPVEQFILSLNTKMKAKLLGILEILQEKGNQLRESYTKYLGDGIFEIRIKVGTDISRVLYFFYYGRIIILTNGFIKKARKTAVKEIALAKKRKMDYLKRK